MNCRRSDVVLVLFPDSSLRTSKRRPALVVQADGLDAHLPQTIVAMITSNMARAGHPSRVIARVGSGGERASGLLMDSVIMTDNLATAKLGAQGIEKIFEVNLTEDERAALLKSAAAVQELVDVMAPKLA